MDNPCLNLKSICLFMKSLKKMSLIDFYSQNRIEMTSEYQQKQHKTHKFIIHRYENVFDRFS